MGGPFDSLGLGLAVAGAVIILAGLFLTPMRDVILGRVSLRPDPPAPQPADAPQAEVNPIPKPDPAAARDRRGVDYREQEALFARTLLTAQKTADELVRNAKLEADEILAKAEAAASETARVSRKNATEITQTAQQDADLIVSSAKQKAAAWLSLLQAEADKLTADAHEAFQGAQRSVEQHVASLTSRFERRMAEWDADPWEQQRAVSGHNGLPASPAERTPARIA